LYQIVGDLIDIEEDSLNDLEESIKLTDAGVCMLYQSYKELENARKNKKR
jgi:hypothetical protein